MAKLLLLAAAVAGVADATYSIVGADRLEALAGISIASCVGALDLDIAVGMAHGPDRSVGAVAAQASVDGQFRGRTRAVEMLRQGEAASAVVTAITTTAVDPSFNSRQYGIVGSSFFSGETSMDWTGASTGAWSGGTQGFSVTGRDPYAAQGNILTGPACVSQSAAGFIAEPTKPPPPPTNATTAAQREDQCFDLPARLMRALLAGAENGEGDVRCTRRSPPVPVDSAYIRVDLPSGEPWLLLSVVDTYPFSAADVLYDEYLLWRVLNPCEDGAGLAAFRGNTTALAVARDGAERHTQQAEETYRRHVAFHGNSSVTV